MAALKYKDSNGDYQTVVGLKVVNNGFRITTDETTGTDTFVALGGATITVDDENGRDIFKH